ncbi:ABC transporter ATP-binding protein [Roseateles oligotrophus]|uniref:ABC transporter ATP-binding protein n=1 Tax=Roseateles oligotrophus TaxID=1769250 RepID=A0ABT2YKR7_9BURK|nr:ABC transporter ATP-binding protein [Roseateles oligotrophus]MCV2370657.1 ABC transporter ATP-binding protein [Roseateles oligotrophus]
MIRLPKLPCVKLLTPCFIAVSLLASPIGARADGMFDLAAPGHWRLAVSPYSYHFHYSEEHRYVWAIGGERQADNGWLWGGSYFSNSFGQPSGYVYLGKRYPGLLDQPQLFAQWSAGLLYGYKGQFQHKVPLNYRGYSPGLLLSLGWAFNQEMAVQANMLGNSGVMLQFSYDFH